MQHESDEEFDNGISPDCVVVQFRGENAVCAELAHYAETIGADYGRVALAQNQARNAMRDGRSASYAYEVGRQSLHHMADMMDVYQTVSHEPISKAWRRAMELGLVDICCTATGVAGNLIEQTKHGRDVYRVTVEVKS